MLELLSLRKGSTLTKEMFLNHLYGAWTSLRVCPETSGWIAEFSEHEAN
jgi:hypothetical protein